MPRHKKDSKSRLKKKAIHPAPYNMRGHIWLDGVEGTFLGYGRVTLMERIKEYGSITRAAKSMDMSYRHAWELIESMNRQTPHPFVLRSTGGKGGGGTVVTEHGERAIALFWGLSGELQEFLLQGTNKILEELCKD